MHAYLAFIYAICLSCFHVQGSWSFFFLEQKAVGVHSVIQRDGPYGHFIILKNNLGFFFGGAALDETVGSSFCLMLDPASKLLDSASGVFGSSRLSGEKFPEPV